MAVNHVVAGIIAVDIIDTFGLAASGDIPTVGGVFKGAVDEEVVGAGSDLRERDFSESLPRTQMETVAAGAVVETVIAAEF